MRLLKSYTPRFTTDTIPPLWPAHWITRPNLEGKSFVVAYRLQITLEAATNCRVHLSADQRYRFFVDGQLEGEGPDRGDAMHWNFHSHELSLSEGTHCLVALVWTLDQEEGLIPGAQVTLRHGLILTADAPHTELLSTGIANWEQKLLQGVKFISNGQSGAGGESGAVVDIDGGRFPWGIEKGLGEGWSPCHSSSRGLSKLSSYNWGILDTPLLVPGMLPPPVSNHFSVNKLRYVGSFEDVNSNLILVSEDHQCEVEYNEFHQLLREGQPLRIRPGEKQWLLLDLDDYYCGYPELTVSGGNGAVIRVLWAESLYEDLDTKGGTKGNRNEIDGKTFFGRGDTFRVGALSESMVFTPFWWSCGRYVAIVVETGREELILERLQIRETGYPLELKARIHLENDAFEHSKSIMWRSLQMCSHETYMDSPYYEQLNYAGDSRVQAAISYVMSGDDRLAMHCIQLFANSKMPNGLIQSRYPSATKQIIPQFSLHWIGMLYEFGVWRGKRDFIKNLLPVSRSILETYLSHVHEDGLLRCPDGWDWIDWAWRGKRAYPRGPEGSNAVNHLQLVYTLGLAGKLEQWVGRQGLGDFYLREQAALFENACNAFWNSERGLFASTSMHDCYDEHSQCFATLSGRLAGEQRDMIRQALVESPDLDRATCYFKHYLFSAYAELGLHSHIIKHFDAWEKMTDLGLKTTLEREDPSRSDCHAWSAHPLYHAVVSICGIQPEGFGFSQVSICPALNLLPSAEARIPHQLGDLGVAWKQNGNVASLSVEIPKGMDATLRLPEMVQNLEWGNHQFEIVLKEELATAPASTLLYSKPVE